MKKFLCTVLSGIFVISLTSCQTGRAETTTTQTETTTTQTETTTIQTETTTTQTETTTTQTETTTTQTETETAAQTETEPAAECKCESEFQHACCEYLNQCGFLAGGVYYGDINGDGKPEAVVEINPLELTYVLYENENGMQELALETMSSWGYVRYIADTKQILFCPAYGHTWGSWGYEEYYLIDWSGSDYEVTSSIIRESGIYYKDENGEEYAEYGQAYIDGEEVDNDTFEAKFAEYEKLRDDNEYFPVITLTDENFENYIKENFPCFDNWEIIPGDYKR